MFAAIEQLLAAGQAPTHMSVRDVLGGRGSGPVLSRLIAKWFAEHGPDYFAKVSNVRSRKPAGDFGAQLRAAAEQAAKVVSDAERERLAALQEREQALEQRAAALDAQEQALFAEQAKLAERASEQERLIAEIRSDKAVLVASLERAREDRLKVEAELSTAASSIAGLNAQLGETLQSAAAAAERERASQVALAEARRELRDHLQTVQEFKLAHSEAMATVRRLQEEQRNHLLASLRRAEERVEAFRVDLAARSSELGKVVQHQSDLQAQLVEAAAALIAAQQEARGLAGVVDSQKETMELLKQELDSSKRQAASLISALHALSAKINDAGGARVGP
ncbi:DNA-binding protein [Xanthomonas sacchari]|uniref:DNA-binding protein n=1 Tax=Xanthomonas sacchari TaxID=56458 RepID=UPI0027D7833A|nr:DNA-binding protein [Xanthomonas sacchari]